MGEEGEVSGFPLYLVIYTSYYKKVILCYDIVTFGEREGHPI